VPSGISFKRIYFSPRSCRSASALQTWQTIQVPLPLQISQRTLFSGSAQQHVSSPQSWPVKPSSQLSQAYKSAEPSHFGHSTKSIKLSFISITYIPPDTLPAFSAPSRPDPLHDRRTFLFQQDYIIGKVIHPEKFNYVVMGFLNTADCGPARCWFR
jgi:hypothetical protein